MGLLVPNLRPDLDALRVDLAAANLRDVVKDGWSVMALSTGMVDAFTDQTGVASLGGAAYDGAAKTVGNPGGYTANLCSGGSALQSSQWGSTYAGAYAFDGTTSAWQPGASETGAGMVGVSYIGYRLASAASVRKIVFDQTTAIYAVSQVKAQAYSAGAWVDVATFAVAAGTNVLILPAGPTVTDWRLLCTATGITYWNVNEITMHAAVSPPGVTVVSSAFGLGFQPSLARIVAPMEMGSGVIGTDGLFDLSRDGSAWGAVPLSDLGKFDASTRIVGGLVNLSGQPAGSSIYWRWRTTAGIAQVLHGVWIQCK